jgi:DNA-binding CsgD family transcriptional regulator
MSVDYPRFVQIDDKSYVHVRGGPLYGGTLIEAHLVPYEDPHNYELELEKLKQVSKRRPWNGRWTETQKRRGRLRQESLEKGGITGLVEAIWISGGRWDDLVQTCTFRGGVETRGGLTINKPYIVNGETLDEVVTRVLRTLTERESQVLRLRYGVEDGQGQTLEKVGRELGVTRERIRQIEARAFQKLRHPTRRKHIQPFVIDAIEGEETDATP